MKFKRTIVPDDNSPILNSPGLPVVSDSLFPLIHPTVPHPSGKRILLLGDSPYDAFSRQPFSNASYGKLKIITSAAGLELNHCYLHNVIDYYMGEPGGFSSSAALARLSSLKREIAELRPDVIICLGANAFYTLFGDLSLPRKAQSVSFEDERGFPRHYHSSPDHHCFVIPTFHPTELFMRHIMSPVAQSDIEKAVRIAVNGWAQPAYSINYWPSFDETCAALDYFYESRTYLSADIETRGTYITCVGLAWDDTNAIVIPFHRERLERRWTDAEEATIWRKLAGVLERCPLVGQNAVHFDTKVLLKYRIRANFVDDTMFAAWQAYQELPKSLGFILSYYTDLPYHKDMLSAARSGRIDYKQEFYYCGLDCCSTFVGLRAIGQELRDRPRGSIDRYRFNINMSRVFEYASGLGCPVDNPKRLLRIKTLKDEAETIEHKLNRELSRTFNVRSPLQVKKLLYDEWGLPATTKVTFDKDEGTQTETTTADYLTLLYLAREFPKFPLIQDIGYLRKLNKRISSLEHIKPDSNGLIYWDFATIGTKFGRASGKKSILHDHGIQPQNVDRRDRDLVIAPPGYSFLKADLEGADSWTQAAQLACLGDHRLMNDLLAGLKPAQRLAISRIMGEQYLSKSTEELLKLKKILKSEDGDLIYQICKAISHGSAYMMQELTMHKNIFKRSEGELYVPPHECKISQQLFFKCYDFPRVHKKMGEIMMTKGYLDFSDGSRQYFLNRRDNATIREMLSAAPQNHTSRAANTTMLRICADPLNRDSSGRLILKPLNQVHDETDGLFKTEDLSRVADIFHRNCDVPQTFWGQTFTIPFEAQYGPDWGHCKTDLVA